MPETQYFTGIDVVLNDSTTLSADAKDSEARQDLSDLNDYVEHLLYNTYSTTEYKIGKWIDGSDLYQRTFDNIPLPYTYSWNNSVLGTTNINIVKAEGLVKMQETGYPASYAPLYYFRDTSNYITFLLTGADINVYVSIPSGSTNTATITIQYTKPVVNNLSNNIRTVDEPNEEPVEELKK